MHGFVSTAERLHRDKDWIANTPGLANCGIALVVLEPETVGWGEIARLLEEYSPDNSPEAPFWLAAVA